MKKQIIISVLSALCSLACSLCLGAVAMGWLDLYAGCDTYSHFDDAVNGMAFCSVVVVLACVFMVALTWLFIADTENVFSRD